MPKQNISPADYPQAVLQQIVLLGQNIAIARKRRGETQGQWASKLGVSQPTMARIERGDPSVAMASYVMCMWLINQAGGLADLVAPLQDHAALERELLRVRPPRKVPAAAPARLTVNATAKPPPKQAAIALATTASHARKPRDPSDQQGTVQPAHQAYPPGGDDSPDGIHLRILASAAKGNATAKGLAALLLQQPRAKAP